MVDKEAYAEKIEKAGPVGLVALNFELTLDFLGKARTMYLGGGPDGIDMARRCVTRAREGLENAIQSLDMGVPIAADFYEVYRYAYGLLCGAQQSSDAGRVLGALDEVAEIVAGFAKAWRGLADKTDEEPIGTGGGPRVYAGLTYGKDGKPIEHIDGGGKGGFRA